jgi:hypothetical protein
MRWAGHVADMRDVKYTVLVVKPEGKRPLWRPRHRWENSTEMHLEEIMCKDLDWIHLAES